MNNGVRSFEGREKLKCSPLYALGYQFDLYVAVPVPHIELWSGGGGLWVWAEFSACWHWYVDGLVASSSSRYNTDTLIVKYTQLIPNHLKFLTKD